MQLFSNGFNVSTGQLQFKIVTPDERIQIFKDRTTNEDCGYTLIWYGCTSIIEQGYTIGVGYGGSHSTEVFSTSEFGVNLGDIVDRNTLRNFVGTIISATYGKCLNARDTHPTTFTRWERGFKAIVVFYIPVHMNTELINQFTEYFLEHFEQIQVMLHL